MEHENVLGLVPITNNLNLDFCINNTVTILVSVHVFWIAKFIH